MYLVCGEALFDCFVEDGGADPARVRIDAAAGGSPFNVARGIARLGGSAAFFGGLSTDLLGRKLRALLEAEGVETRYAVEVPAPTPLGIVGVGADGAASYAFHHRGSAAVAPDPAAVPVLDQRIDGLHFGSFALVAEPAADALAALAAANGGRFIALDPNVRPAVEPGRPEWRRRIEAMAARAHLVKASREDLAWLYPEDEAADTARRWVEAGAALVVVTDGAGPVRAYRPGEELAHPVPPVAVEDTVGAGDAFQAALLTRVAELGPPADVVAGLGGAALREVLAFAAEAAALTCARRSAEAPVRAELTA